MAGWGHAAADHAECCICFDALCAEPVAVLLDGDDVRACPHYFHFDCIKDMCPFTTRGYGIEMEVEETGEGEQQCPMCRALFMSIARMPDPVEEPMEWFRFVDSDATGFLSYSNVRDVVNATCVIDERQLKQILDDNWAQWDHTRSGGITRPELPRLLNFVLAHSAQQRPAVVPSIVSDTHAWFDYWDESRSGALTKEETVRAIVKTFDRGTMTPQKVREVQQAVYNVWCVFDTNGSDSITRAEFLAADGLADVVIALLQRSFAASLAAAGLQGRAAVTDHALNTTPTPAEMQEREQCEASPSPRTSSIVSNSDAPLTANTTQPPAEPIRRRGARLLRTCVVCNNTTAAGLLRGAGWKCLRCVGVPSRWATRSHP